MPSRFLRFSVIVEDGRGALYLERVVSHSPDGARKAAINRVVRRLHKQWPDEKTFSLMTRDNFSVKYAFRGHVREA